MRLLIVKLSSLGDVVHALPVVHDIRLAHPRAVIDRVVEPGFAPLLRCGPGPSARGGRRTRATTSSVLQRESERLAPLPWCVATGCAVAVAA